MPTITVVGGTWDDNGGDESSVIKRISHGLTAEHLLGIEIFNGGSFQKLDHVFRLLKDSDAVLWMPNISNTHPKQYIQTMKKVYPKLMLVSSKRNFDNQYSFQDVVAHGLNIKSNLILEIKRRGDYYTGELLDPLGNVWCPETPNFFAIGLFMARRLKELMSITRQATIQSPEDAIPMYDNASFDLAHFFATVKRKAEVFHELIHPAEGVTRFLGNSSFRCERGFPSVKLHEGIYVSRRNVDKRYIGPEAFVHTGWNKEQNIIWYRGDHKPSVDTPIQLRLYDMVPSWVRYMLHSHVYILGAPYTSKMIPCGGLEEVDEIMKIVNSMEEPNMTCYAINLKGHGSIIMARSPSYFDVEYVSRPMPEYM